MLMNSRPGWLVDDATSPKRVRDFSNLKIVKSQVLFWVKEFSCNVYRKILINWLQSLETMPPRWSEICTLESSTSAAPTAAASSRKSTVTQVWGSLTATDG